MISQLMVLSPRGDVIILKDFKGNVSKSSPEVLFRTVASGKDAARPVFCIDGTNYAYINAGNLYWGVTTRENASPSLLIEILNRLFWIVNDYVGHVSEESVRRNFVLVYELVDEIMDFGFPQNSSTERLKEFIAMEPSVMRPKKTGTLPSGPKEVVKSVLSTSRTGAREEIFVDIVEKLTAIFDSSGRLRNSSIVGSVQVKSYLHGTPRIRLGLPESLVLAGEGDGQIQGGDFPLQFGSSVEPIILDTYSLHENVDRDVFARNRILELTPPEGHFSLITYRSSRSFSPPFVVTPIVEDDPYSPDKMTVHISLQSDYGRGSLLNTPKPKSATGVEVVLPLPPTVSRAHIELDSDENKGPLLSKLAGTSFSQSAEWNAKESKVVWNLKNVPNGCDHVLRIRLTVEGERYMVRHEMGPVMVHFVLPGKPTMSGLDIGYMKIMGEPKETALGSGRKNQQQPSRWFRSVCMAQTYLVRID
jgi:AP-4 complex subunit mu-1